jgi:arginyl-tRNA synthetase
MKSMREQLIEALKKAVSGLGIEDAAIALEYPENLEHGDFSANLALAESKRLKISPRALAEKIVSEFKKEIEAGGADFIESVSIAGPGFINFKVKDKVLAEKIVELAAADSKASRTESNAGQKIMVEYTDPNTFKPFHIGHLMSNAIGESLSRLIEFSGVEVTRLCYPADIGLHIAKSVWALQKNLDKMPHDGAPIAERTAFLGKMYVEGTAAYEADPAAKDDIDALNKVLYERSSKDVNALYEKGRKWSLDHFESLYELLGTKFDGMIFESEMAPVGLDIVREFAKKGVFEESDGAIVFKGEKYGLHTRVFINSYGLPTYEAKEMGLNTTKFERYPGLAQSIIVTANEQNEYFKVVIKALVEIDANVGSKTKHIGHGMMRFQSGKMSSRTGNVVTAEALIAEIKAMVMEKMAGREFSADEAGEVSDMVAIAAIKYTILRQGIGGDVIFDSAKSISFEGDSGPYLQYSAVRAQSVLIKAEGAELSRGRGENVVVIPASRSEAKAQVGIQGHASKTLDPRFRGDDTEVRTIGTDAISDRGKHPRRFRSSVPAAFQLPETVGLLEKLIIRFPDIAERARQEYAPQHIANYLINLAGAFNAFYGTSVIVDAKEPLSPYRIELTKAFLKTMTEGLWLLGIKVPRRM